MAEQVQLYIYLYWCPAQRWAMTWGFPTRLTTERWKRRCQSIGWWCQGPFYPSWQLACFRRGSGRCTWPTTEENHPIPGSQRWGWECTCVREKRHFLALIISDNCRLNALLSEDIFLKLWNVWGSFCSDCTVSIKCWNDSLIDGLNDSFMNSLNNWFESFQSFNTTQSKKCSALWLWVGAAFLCIVELFE